MTNFGRALLAALTLGGAAIWGCASESPSAANDQPLEEPGAPSSAPATVEQALQTQPVTAPQLTRVAPQHLEAAQRGLAQRLSRSSHGLKVHVAHDGSRRVDLEGRFSHVLIANQDETGKAQVMCAGSPEEVAKALGN